MNVKNFKVPCTYVWKDKNKFINGFRKYRLFYDTNLFVPL